MISKEHTGLANHLVYVVDDDVAIANLVFHSLEAQGYRSKSFYSGTAMLEEVRNDHPDLIILDVMMPGIDGVGVARQVRSFSKVPIMMLSVRSDTGVKATALDVGADDYMTKPFDIEELMARVRAILRRSLPAQNWQSARVYQSEYLSIDLESSLATVAGTPVKLTPREWSVLRVLIKYVGQVVTPRQLLQEAWGPAYGDEADYVRAYITRLRRKLEPDPKIPRYILLEWGAGYRLANPDPAPGVSYRHD
ncbi:MAG: response regulator transcription factor [Chloroflexi bacterium]|nr:response regulator transcription factor [Chloroflexota bacterium]